MVMFSTSSRQHETTCQVVVKGQCTLWLNMPQHVVLSATTLTGVCKQIRLKIILVLSLYHVHKQGVHWNYFLSVQIFISVQYSNVNSFKYKLASSGLAECYLCLNIGRYFSSH